MDELDKLLGNLGQGIDNPKTIDDFVGDDMARLQDRRSKRLSRGHTRTQEVKKAPQARPTSGLEDLDSLMAELGGSPPVARKSINATGGTTSIVGRAQPAGPASSDFDEIDALVAGMSVGTPAAAKPAPAISNKPAPSAAVAHRAVAPPAAATGNGDAGLDDLDAIVASLSSSPSLGSSASKNIPSPSGQRPQGRALPPSGYGSVPGMSQVASRASLGPAAAAPTHASAAPRPTVAPATAARPPPQQQPLEDDLEALISSLSSQPAAPLPAATPAVAASRPPVAAGGGGSGFAGAPIVAQDPINDMLSDFRQAMGDPASATPSKGVCATCRKPIHAQLMQALGKSYHTSCFVCTNCGDSLGTGTFYQTDGNPNCQRCYEALFCARCGHCDQPIQGSCINALGKKWHVNCFICSQCLRPFGTNPFFERDNNPFCEACFQGIFCSRCAGCDQPIKGDTVNACGKQWHPEHFACTHCKKAFGSTPYFEHNGMPYCQLHFHSQQGSVCGCGCGRPVMGRVIQALGKQWIPEHFVCGFCMNTLAGQNFTQRDGKAYCNVCFAKLYN